METEFKTLKDAISIIYNKNNCYFIKSRIGVVFQTFCIEMMPKLYLYGFYCCIAVTMWYIQTIMVFTTYFRIRNYVKPGQRLQDLHIQQNHMIQDIKEKDKLEQAENRLNQSNVNERKQMVIRNEMFYGKGLSKLANVDLYTSKQPQKIEAKEGEQEEDVRSSNRSSSLGSYEQKDPNLIAQLYQNQVSLEFDEESDEELKKARMKTGRKTTNNQTSNHTEK